MLVFQNKRTQQYVKRLYLDEPFSRAETFRHVDTLEEASLLGGWWEIAEWSQRRARLGFDPLPAEWQIVVIELVNNPTRKIIGHAG